MSVDTADDTANRRHADDQQLVKNPYARVVFCGNDEILIKHGGRSRYSQVLNDEARSGLLGRVLRAFSEPRSVADLQAAGIYSEDEQDSVHELIDYLLERQVLILPEAHLPSTYLKMHFGDGASNVSETRIGLAGAGPLGARIAADLGQLRPSEIVVLDDRPANAAGLDAYDLPVGDDAAGKPYGQLLTEGLTGNVALADGALDDEVALTDLFERSDLVIVALETYSPQVLHAVNSVALALEKPWLSVFSDGSQAFVGPVYVPGETPCYAEFEIQQEATVAIRDDYLVYKESVVAEGWHTGVQLISPYLSVMAGWATTTLLNFLTGSQPFGVGRCVWIDFERLSIDYSDVLKLPRCPACLQQQTGYPRHLFL